MNLGRWRFLSLLFWGIAMADFAFAQPTIISQPVSTSAAVGSTVGFSVAASGVGTIYYQWRKNVTNMVNGPVFGAATVSGATTAALSLTGITTNDMTTFSCLVTNVSGSVTSSVATLAVVVPPAITLQPKSYNTNVGANITFSTVAGGTAPLSYQWYKDGNLIAGATLNTYNLNGLFLSDTGIYNVRVSNSAGSITSSNAVLNVGIAPSITGQPVSLIVTQGQSATFTVTASGSPLIYRWLKNFQFIPGQTNNSLTFASAAITNAAIYTCQVSNFLGSVTSTGAVLTVVFPPAISVQPVSQTIGVGSNFTVSVTASGNPAVAYQWRTNGTAVPGATSASFTLTSAQTNNSGNYDVVITNSVGSITSSVAAISVVYYPPAISQQPVGGNIAVGSSFVLNASATGTAPLYWQWRTNGNPIPGANASSYVINFAQMTDAGSYNVVVTNSTGSVTSSAAVLNVGYAPVVVLQPVSLTNSVGGTANFSCIVTGSVPINLQWTLNGNPLSGATNTTLTLTNLQPGSIGYYALTATNLFGGTVSSNATLNLTDYDFGIWNGLVAYFPFNGNANDASGNGNNGTNYGASLTPDRFGNINAAYTFSGSNWINIGSVVSRYDLLSIAAWIKTTYPSSPEMAVVSKPNDLTTLTGSRLGTYGGSLDSGFASDANTFINAVVFGAKPANDGTWHQGFYVNDGTNLQLFVDGQLVGVQAYSPQVSTSTEPMLIGQEFPTNWGVGTRSFIGVIDDVRIYNRALSSNEVASLYVLEADVPIITQQPLAQTLNAGGMATFSVAATANHPLTYQWRKEGTPISGATNSFLTLTNVQSADVSFYSVAISNALTSVVSASALLNLTGYADPTWKGLVAYYPFNGNANDASGNGKNGTLYGSVLANDRFGKANEAYLFNGVDNYINVSNIIQRLDVGTFSVWFKQTVSRSITESLIHKRRSPGGDGFGIGRLSGNVSGFCNREPSISQNPSGIVDANNTSDEEWHQAVVSADGATLRLYVDGNVSGELALVSGAVSGSEEIWIGRGFQNPPDGGGVRAFAGWIDDVRIYSRALSPDEVGHLYALESQSTLQPPQTLSASSGAGPSMHLNLTALPGRGYVLQTATNLSPPIPWQSVLTNTTDANGVWQFVETNLNSSRKFYRTTTP